MTNPTLSNDISNKTAILWQYDHAPNLKALVSGLDDLAVRGVTLFWDYIAAKVVNIDDADSFGLEIWGGLLGLSRPVLRIPEAGTSPVVWKSEPISDSFFRRLLKARFFMLNAAPSIANLNRYLALVFGTDASTGLSRSKVVDHLDMSFGTTFPADATEEEAYLLFEHLEALAFYPAGIRLPAAQARNKSPFAMPSGVIGTDGQGLENFAENFAWADETSENGGIFSGNIEANYWGVPRWGGEAYIVSVSAGDSKSLVLGSDEQAWIDWGDGVKGYNSLAGDSTYTHVYDTDGIYAIAVRYPAGQSVVTTPSGASKTYVLE